ncbi:MAG: Protein-export rane protein SecF [Dehalococcoidia bacterium]|nr:Protein-export rane protein SecF [Dehalococcoidia bacterium]
MDFVGKRNWYFLLSFVVALVGVVSLLLPGNLRAGIEFTGGSTMTLEFQEEVGQEQLRSQLAALGHPDAIIQGMGDSTFFIRTRTLKEAQPGEQSALSEKETILNTLEANLGPMVGAPNFFSVSPTIATETVRNAIIAVVVASVAILLYITWAFRRVPSPFRYGVTAVVALVHDVVVVLGMFSLFGRFFNFEVNAMFISAVLTIIGYSVHDTIVVFDRIRENISRGVGRNLDSTVNISIQETLGRSLNTSLTLLFTILALLLFGGATIRDFLVVLLVGIIAGTYSSICIASQLLLVWENGDIGKLFRRRSRPARVQGG